MTHSFLRYLGGSDEPVETVSPEESAQSMVSRVQQRADELKRTFELLPEEVFMDEFYCALHKKILLQGRMYVFENYICFYSNLFGWVKKKIIPLAEVVEVSKKRNYGFPNSIKVSWKGKKEFFTSFLSRDDAFNLIMNAWSQAKQGMSPDFVHDRNRRLSEPSLNNSLDHEIQDVQIPGDVPTFVPGRIDRSKSDISGTSSSRKRSMALKLRRDSSNLEHDTESDPDDDDVDAWIVQAGPLPPIPCNMSLLMQGDFQASVRDFFDKILSTESVFFEEYHKARGDQRYRLTHWQRHSGLDSVVRCATFMSPVKAPGGFRVGLISPKETECNQNQQYRVYEGTSIMFETSQVMKDIPYGDNFTVETCWIIESTPIGCHVSIHGSVPFVRSVISPIRKMIESSVMREMKDSMRKLFGLLTDALVDSPSASMSECLQDNNSWNENLDKLLEQKDVRAKLVALLQEGLGEIEQRDTLKGTGPYESVPSHDPQHASPVHLESSGIFPKAVRAAFYVPSENVHLLTLVLVVIVLIVQSAFLFLWIYPPQGQVGNYSPSTRLTDRLHLQESFACMSQELEILDKRLAVLIQSVKQAAEYVDSTKHIESA